MKQERLQNFCPQSKGSQTFTPTVASQRVTFPKADLTVRINNSTNKKIWVALGDANVIAETGVDMPIAPVELSGTVFGAGTMLVDMLNHTHIAFMVDSVAALAGEVTFTPGTGN